MRSNGNRNSFKNAEKAGFFGYIGLHTRIIRIRVFGGRGHTVTVIAPSQWVSVGLVHWIPYVLALQQMDDVDQARAFDKPISPLLLGIPLNVAVICAYQLNEIFAHPTLGHPHTYTGSENCMTPVMKSHIQ
jgi:hypothetical protein